MKGKWLVSSLFSMNSSYTSTIHRLAHDNYKNEKLEEENGRAVLKEKGNETQWSNGRILCPRLPGRIFPLNRVINFAQPSPSWPIVWAIKRNISVRHKTTQNRRLSGSPFPVKREPDDAHLLQNVVTSITWLGAACKANEFHLATGQLECAKTLERRLIKSLSLKVAERIQ